MPQIPYTVTFPDGGKVTFSGPESMSDLDVQNRAIQERAFKEGKIPTTWLGGAAKELASDKATTGALSAGAGMAVGGPIGAGIVAASPLIAEGMKSASTGEMPTASDLATDAVEGAATLTPLAFSKVGGTLASEVAKTSGKTLPQALAKGAAKIVGPMADEAEAISPQAIHKTGSDVWELMKQTATRIKSGVTASDVDQMRDLVKTGYKPSTAARIVVGKDAGKMSALMNLYLRPVVGLK